MGCEEFPERPPRSQRKTLLTPPSLSLRSLRALREKTSNLRSPALLAQNRKQFPLGIRLRLRSIQVEVPRVQQPPRIHIPHGRQDVLLQVRMVLLQFREH